MATMTRNPAFLQGALQRSMVSNPYSATGNTAKVTGDETSKAMRDSLAMREYGLRKRMNEAQIIDMSNRLKLGQQQLGLATQTQNWREKNWRKAYDTEESNLWKTAALGLGTSAWSAYEGNRRAGLIREETERNKLDSERLRKYLNLSGGNYDTMIQGIATSGYGGGR